jgi:hypothetical protein
LSAPVKFDVVNGHKQCAACGIVRRLDDFRYEPRVASKTTARCIECLRSGNKAYRETHPENIKASRDKYVAKYPERVAQARSFTNRRAKLERAECRLRETGSILEPRATEEDRRCSSCRRRKPICEFGAWASDSDGLHCYCRECSNRKARQYAKKPETSEYRKKYMRQMGLKKYGLTIEDFERLLSGQNGRCLICEDELELRTGGAAVDHDHESGKVRGVLCRLCNVGIGHFREKPSLLRAAIEYLENEMTEKD